MKKLEKYIVPKDIKEAIISAIMSFLTTFSLLFLLIEKLYEQKSSYQEFIVGLTTFSGYPKKADLTVIQLILLGLILFFILWTIMLRFFKEHVRSSRQITGSILGSAVLTQVCVFGEKRYAAQIGIITVLLLVLALILFYKKEQETITYVNYACALIFTTFSFFGGYTVLGMLSDYFAKNSKLFFASLGLIWFLFFGLLFYYRKKEKLLEQAENILILSQLLIPLGLLSMYRFDYLYEATGEVIRLFYSKKFRVLLLLFVAISIGYEIYIVWKQFVQKKSRHNYKIMLTSVIGVGMMQVYALPAAKMNIDFFHNGEITVPMQQFMSFHSLAYKDMIPIHGFCDYFFGGIDYLFFDGSFLSLNAAAVVGNLFMIGVLAAVVYFTVEQKQLSVMIVFLFSRFFVITAGMRYFMLFVMFFVLFSEKVIKKPLSLLWWWTFLCICAIAWNPSIGGSGAVAFLPIIIWEVCSQGLGELKALWGEVRVKTPKRFYQILTAYGVLFVLGLSFIPLFLQIVTYLRENTATTIETNGMAVFSNSAHLHEYLVPGLITKADGFFVQTFLMVLPLIIAICLVFANGLKTWKKRFIYISISLIACYYVIINYAFVRYDDGLRTGVVGVFFSIVVAMLIINSIHMLADKQDIAMVFGMLFIFLCLYVEDVPLLTNPFEAMQIGSVKESETIMLAGSQLEDPIVYVTGESVGIKGLGNGFISGNSLNSLKNIQHVLLSTVGERGSYLDLTNAVANYVIFDQKSSLPYTSGYNISNEIMQNKAIEMMEKEQPRLVLLAPFIKFDDATISIRSPILYDYLLDSGYRPYAYENVLYLVKDIPPVEGSIDGMEAFASLMHKENLEFLPMVYGESGLEQKLLQVVKNYQIKEQEGKKTIVFDAPIAGSSVDYLSIHLENIKHQASRLDELSKFDQVTRKDDLSADVDIDEEAITKLPHMTIRFRSDVTGQEKECNFSVLLSGADYLIPLRSSPYWSQEDELGQIEIILEDTQYSLTDSKIKLLK